MQWWLRTVLKKTIVMSSLQFKGWRLSRKKFIFWDNFFYLQHKCSYHKFDQQQERNFCSFQHRKHLFETTDASAGECYGWFLLPQSFVYSRNKPVVPLFTTLVALTHQNSWHDHYLSKSVPLTASQQDYAYLNKLSHWLLLALAFLYSPPYSDICLIPPVLIYS